VPINIDVETRRSRTEEDYGHELVAPIEMYREKGLLASPQALNRAASGRTIKFQSSKSTLGSSLAKSPLSAEFPDYPVDHDGVGVSSSDDAHQPASIAAKGSTGTGTSVAVTVVTKHD
jgi:hypothetical protein